jgi:spore maturation protein CgeB
VARGGKKLGIGLLMKIFQLSMQYDYGDVARGESYEYHNFYKTWLSMGHEVQFFDFMSQERLLGRSKMNETLLKEAKAFAPDVVVASLYTDQIFPKTALELRNQCKTLCFFHDDMWRKDFSQFWASHFDYFTSSDFEAANKYRKLGLPNLIHMPFGVNEKLYTPSNEPLQFDVSFVGQWDPYREWIISRLRRAGLRVHVVGYRWPAGVVSLQEMVRIFGVSKINLNLSNSASWDARYLLSSPKAIINRIRTKKTVEQIKARHFEISACRSFQLSYYVDGIERCYRIGEEIGVYLNPDDLLDKALYYLENEELRQSMANASYKRTLTDHTYTQRFSRAFSIMGLV